MVACIATVAASLVVANARPAHAATGFTAGDVVVYRVGTGSAALGKTGTAVFLDEYTPSGSLVQSVALPTAASGNNKPLVASGTASSEGMLTLSADSSVLVATGYDTTPGAADPSAATSASVPRTVATVNNSDAINSTTALTDVASKNNIRSAASSNGSSFWIGSADSSSGVRYATLGATTSTAILNSVYSNGRQVAIANGQLYVSADPTKNSTAPTPLTIATVGTGLPTTGSISPTNLPFSSAPAQPYAYSFVTLGTGTAPDTLYVADNSAGAVLKYSLVSGSWVPKGSVSVPGVTGVTADDIGGVVSIFATTSGTAGTAGTLYSISDSSGAGGTLSGTATQIAAAGTNQAFRGVAFAPGTVFGSGGPPPPVVPTITPAHTGLPAALGDPSNPTDTITVGDTKYASNLSQLTVSASSGTTSVAPQSGISVTGTGATRTLTVTPGSTVGYSTITLTVTAPDGQTAQTTVTYGLSASLGNSSDRYFSGAGNLSTAIDVGGGYMVVGDDENNIIRLYNETQSGPPVKTFDFTGQLPYGTTEVDIEASARAGNTLYWMGSMSNSSSGKLEPARNTLFAATISGSGANTTLTYLGSYTGLQADLINWDDTNGHGLGADYFGLDASVNGGTINHATNSLELEGMEFAPGSTTTAYFAFRGPIEPASNRQDALVVPLTNINSLLTAGGTGTTHASFGAPLLWNLGGLGIRELRANDDGQYLLIAGTADGTNSSFVLYNWDGNPLDQPVPTNTALPLTPSGANQGSWESIVSVPEPLTSGASLQLIEDNGDTAWYGDTQTSKDTLPADLQKDLSRVFTYSPPSPNSVVITANNQSRAYGVADPTFTFTTAGLRGSDMFTTQPTCTVSGDDSAVGTYPITCSGAVTSSQNDAISYVAGMLTVTKAPVSVAVTASSNPNVTGQTLQFTASVQPNGPVGNNVPTGNVSFTLNGSQLTNCTTQNVEGEVAICGLPNGLAVGSYQIVATYTGDASYAAGDSSATPFTETVGQAATTGQLTASPNPATVGQPVTFTATISVNLPGTSAAIAPSGSVEFQAGSTVINGCANVSIDANGVATCPDPGDLPAGTSTITATYAGDTNFTSSMATLPLEVKPDTYLFVDENPSGPNEVRNYRVNADGTTTLVGAYATGHPGENGSWVVAPRSAIAQTSNHLYALNLGDQTVSEFSVDPTTGVLTLLGTTPSLNATTIAVNPSGTVLYAGGSVNAGSAEQLSTYTIGTNGLINPGPVQSVAAEVDGLSVSPDGNEVAAAYPGTSAVDPNVEVWSTDSAGDLLALDTIAAPCATDVRWTSNTTLVSPSCYSGQLEALTVDRNFDKISVSRSTPTVSQTVAVGPDGTVYFDTASGLQGSDPTTLAAGPTTAYSASETIASMVVTPDGKELFVGNVFGTNVDEYSIAADKTLTSSGQLTVPAGSLPTLIAYTPSEPTGQTGGSSGAGGGASNESSLAVRPLTLATVVDGHAKASKPAAKPRRSTPARRRLACASAQLAILATSLGYEGPVVA